MRTALPCIHFGSWLLCTISQEESCCGVPWNQGTHQSTLLLSHHIPMDTYYSMNSSGGAVISRDWWNPFLTNPEDRQGLAGVCTVQSQFLVPISLSPGCWSWAISYLLEKNYFHFLPDHIGYFFFHCCAWQGWLDSASQSRALCSQSTQERAQDS